MTSRAPDSAGHHLAEERERIVDVASRRNTQRLRVERDVRGHLIADLWRMVRATGELAFAILGREVRRRDTHVAVECTGCLVQQRSDVRFPTEAPDDVVL